MGEGFPQNSVAWYRRSFALPGADAGKRLWLEFDGAFRDCTVFVNGWFVGHHESGYSSFRYDITDVANCGGANVVAVKVDASQSEGWFYEGAGLYRHVWLVKTAPLAVAPDGVFVYNRFKGNVPVGPDEIQLEARLLNSQGTGADASVTWEISEPGGRTFTTAAQSIHLDPWQSVDVAQTAEIRAAQLWSPETPRLYTLVTIVASQSRIVDRVETPFGIRTFAFDATKGFLLNGRPYPLKGTSNHQDHAGVGAALPDGAAVLPDLPAEGDGLQRLPHGAQPADPRAPGRLRPAGNAGDGREPPAGQRPRAPRAVLERPDQAGPQPCLASAIWSLGNEE